MLDGIDPIPEHDRRGTPRDLFWTWSAPNCKFATLLVGVLPVAIFGGGVWPSIVGLVLGTAFGAVMVGILSSGPRFGIAQLVQVARQLRPCGQPPASSSQLHQCRARVVRGEYAQCHVRSGHTQRGAVPGCVPVVIALQVGLACCGLAVISRFTRLVAPALTCISSWS